MTNQQKKSLYAEGKSIYNYYQHSERGFYNLFPTNQDMLYLANQLEKSLDYIQERLNVFLAR